MQTIIENSKYTVVKPQYSVTAANAHLFEGELTTALKQNPHGALLVDLEQIEFLDSAGLMVLISNWKLAQTLKTRFSLCSISPSVRIIIELAQLDSVFEIFDCQATYTAKALMKSFQS
ncbi:MAG: STAS domain-containing protein [Rivularia sp. (in: cyanobacteria)]